MSLDVYLTAVIPTTVFSANITHNLGEMADKAGIYQACWRPEEIGAKHASDIIPLLEKGLEDKNNAVVNDLQLIIDGINRFTQRNL